MRIPSMLAVSTLLGVTACGDAAPLSEPEAAGSPAVAAAAPVPAFRQVVTSPYGHACGITTDDRAYCWGDARGGGLGTGSETGPETCLTDGIEFPCSTRPVAVAGGLAFRQLSLGMSSSCGVTTDDRAYCWGLNVDGELGDGTYRTRLAPVPVAGSFRFRSVSSAGFHTCGVTTDDRAYCWGSNFYGELGDGTSAGRLVPSPVASRYRWRQVDAGSEHTCGVTTDGRAFCWGRNLSGQLGDSTTVHRRFRPRLVAGGHLFRQVEAGGRHSCGVTTDNRAYCWGDGRKGQLGNGKTYLSFWPRAVVGGLSVERVTLGVEHTCGVTIRKRAYCWGLNSWGELGTGNLSSSLRPVAVTGALSFRQLSAGEYFTCGATTGSVAYCWGLNVFGELGIGSYDDTVHMAPLHVVAPS